MPAYNIQIGVAYERIAVVDVQQFCSDVDCFVLLMKRFKELYGSYLECPVADADYFAHNS